MRSLDRIEDVYAEHLLVLEGQGYHLEGEHYSLRFVIDEQEIDRLRFKTPQFGTYWLGVTFLSIGVSDGYKLRQDDSAQSALSITSDCVKSQNYNSAGFLFICSTQTMHDTGFVGVDCGRERMFSVKTGTSERMQFVLSDLKGVPLSVPKDFDFESCCLGVTLARSRRILGE